MHIAHCISYIVIVIHVSVIHLDCSINILCHAIIYSPGLAQKLFEREIGCWIASIKILLGKKLWDHKIITPQLKHVLFVELNNIQIFQLTKIFNG